MDSNTILIISPQPWGALHISKHHYAIELARCGYQVFFLEPPYRQLAEPVLIEPTGYDNLKKVSYRFSNNLVLRYKFRFLYDRLVTAKINSLLAKLGKIKVTWCFDPNLYNDLRKFKAHYSILHMVDPVTETQKAVFEFADIVFAVSEKICSRIRSITNKPVYFINHGLSYSYAELASVNETSGSTGNSKISAGFIGNLLRGPINHDFFMDVIQQYPHVDFHFWGPIDKKNNNLGEDNMPEVGRFINFLQKQPNVVLHGKSTPAQIVNQAVPMNMMILAYKEIDGVYDNSNSHKLLEYLAIGKMVLTTTIDQYKDIDKSLIAMVPPDDRSGFSATFGELLGKLDQLNEPALISRRRSLAAGNTYPNQLQKIKELCRKHGIEF
jgi:hypothetical protein